MGKKQEPLDEPIHSQVFGDNEGKEEDEGIDREKPYGPSANLREMLVVTEKLDDGSFTAFAARESQVHEQETPNSMGGIRIGVGEGPTEIDALKSLVNDLECGGALK